LKLRRSASRLHASRAKRYTSRKNTLWT
jgi:hypothetical protein